MHACKEVYLFLSFANLVEFGKKIDLIVLKCCAVASDRERGQGRVWFWLKEEQLHVDSVHIHYKLT